jgi:hypothetical protein
MTLSIPIKKALYAQVLSSLRKNNITYDRRNGFDYYLNLFYTAKTGEYVGIQFDYSDGFISLNQEQYTDLLDSITNYQDYVTTNK